MKENQKQSWKGHWVAVPHNLTTDPADMQGKLGRIQQIDQQGDVWVYFPGEDCTAKYSADQLLTLAPKSLMLSSVANSERELTVTDQLSIYQVFGSVLKRNFRGALEKAMQSDTTTSHCLAKFGEYMDMVALSKANKHKRGKTL